MSTGATIAIGAVVVFLLLVVFLATTSGRRDRADAVGVLSRETKRRDRSSEALEALVPAEAPGPVTGREIERVYVDKGYRGHDAPKPRSVFISGQKRGVFGLIKRELRRRSAIEPVIGHMKAEGHLGRCYLKGRAGDAANAILAAVGYNFRRVLAWLRILLCQIWQALSLLFSIQMALNPAS